MTRMEEISGKLGELNAKIIKVKGDLAAAIALERDQERAYERAVHRCFAGEIPQAEEAEARAAWDASKIEIDRLKRILPMLEAQGGPLEKDLKSEQWAAALETAEEAERTLRELAEQISDKHEEAAMLGLKMMEVQEAARLSMQVLNRPKFSEIALAQEAWKKRQAGRSRPLYVFPFGAS